MLYSFYDFYLKNKNLMKVTDNVSTFEVLQVGYICVHSIRMFESNEKKKKFSFEILFFVFL